MSARSPWVCPCGYQNYSNRERCNGCMAERGHELGPTPDNTPGHGLSWRDGLDALDALLNDCAQIGEDYQNFVRVSAVRDIVAAVRRYEDDTDESIRSALWEDAVVNGEPWTEEPS